MKLSFVPPFFKPIDPILEAIMTTLKYLFFSGLFLSISCGDQEIESVVQTEDDTTEETVTPDETINYIEPVAVGFELYTGWNQQTGELLGWMLDDGSEQSPYVVITLASADYFYGTDPLESTCQLYAEFVIDPLADLLKAEGYNWPGGPGSSGQSVALWSNASYEGHLEIFAENPDSNCKGIEQSAFPTGHFLDAFNFMHFGIGFSELSSNTGEWLSGAWDTDRNGSLSDEELNLWMTDSTSFMSQYIAVNHQDSSDPSGYNFVGYDWNYGRGFDYDSESLEILTEDCASDPTQQCLVPVDMQADQGLNSVYIMSGAKWYEDLPYLNLSLMQEGNGYQ